MKKIVLLALAASLSACATPTGGIDLDDRLAAAAPAIERIQSSYDAAKRLVDLFLPYVSPARADQIRALGALVDRALYAARTASNIAAQKAAIEEARAATAQFLVVSGG